MEILGIVLAVVVLAGVAIAFGWRPLRRFGKRVHVERAREAFRLQRERLEAKFLQAAQASGKPRGLRWPDCEFDSDALFVRDKKTGELAALVGVTIQFEAVPGSDMEDNPNVGNLRNASAVFYFQRGHWNTVGKAVFNMNPNEAALHFKNLYERVTP